MGGYCNKRLVNGVILVCHSLMEKMTQTWNINLLFKSIVICIWKKYERGAVHLTSVAYLGFVRGRGAKGGVGPSHITYVACKREYCFFRMLSGAPPPPPPCILLCLTFLFLFQFSAIGVTFSFFFFFFLSNFVAEYNIFDPKEPSWIQEYNLKVNYFHKI